MFIDNENGWVYGGNVIAEEFALPGQYDQRWNGEYLSQRRQICAMISQAVSDVRSATNDKDWEDAARWITGEDGSKTTEPYCFDDLCEAIGINGDAVRKQLREERFLPPTGRRLSREGIRKVGRRNRATVWR